MLICPERLWTFSLPFAGSPSWPILGYTHVTRYLRKVIGLTLTKRVVTRRSASLASSSSAPLSGSPAAFANSWHTSFSPSTTCKTYVQHQNTWDISAWSLKNGKLKMFICKDYDSLKSAFGVWPRHSYSNKSRRNDKYPCKFPVRQSNCDENFQFYAGPRIKPWI